MSMARSRSIVNLLSQSTLFTLYFKKPTSSLAQGGHDASTIRISLLIIDCPALSLKHKKSARLLNLRSRDSFEKAVDRYKGCLPLIHTLFTQYGLDFFHHF